MHYIIYRTTDLTNGKVYIGKHRTDDLDDGYLGSGKLLRRAIEKHGRENFKREILHKLSSEEEMNAKEAELVTEEFVKSDDNYNLCVGGQGGFSHINSRTSSEEYARRARMNFKRFQSHKGTPVSEARKQQLRSLYKGRPVASGTLGLKFKKREGSSSGSKNSQFGSIWITNGFETRKIQSLDAIPEGWYRGRKIHAPLAQLVRASDS